MVDEAAVDGVPSGITSHYCEGVTFLESCHGDCSDGYMPVDVTSATLSSGFHGSFASNTTPSYLVCKFLSCPGGALLDDDTVEGLDRLRRQIDTLQQEALR